MSNIIKQYSCQYTKEALAQEISSLEWLKKAYQAGQQFHHNKVKFWCHNLINITIFILLFVSIIFTELYVIPSAPTIMGIFLGALLLTHFI